MIKINGQHNHAICYTDALDAKSAEQIKLVCDRDEFAKSKIRIMPDVHAGMGCTIGTTMTIDDKVVPGMVGVDIGCGMETVQLEQREIDFESLDKLIRKCIPAGRNVRRKHHDFESEIDLTELRCADLVDIDRARKSIGTLGGGNHFIEVDKSESGVLYLVVHSGSRHLGTEVAEHYQKLAQKILCGDGDDSIPKDLAYVSGENFDNYIHDMKIVQRFATLNRLAMIEVILSKMELTEVERFTTIHNYIDTDSMILRKGAVSARAGERLLIPINMRDGSLICVGKGNADWNFSAPHGAGRLMSRRAAYQSLSLDEYQKSMEGIFTTSVGKWTLDEAPMAYKTADEIIKHIGETAEILDFVKPVYNFKAAD